MKEEKMKRMNPLKKENSNVIENFIFLKI